MTSALVLGMSIHGLAICRALGKRGIVTYAIAAQKAPANLTRFATVLINPLVNSGDVACVLQEIGPTISKQSKTVLLPTNDTMVREIGIAWDVLKAWYAVSWSSSIRAVLDLQRKDRLPEIAAAAGIRHPASLIIQQGEDVLRIAATIGYPCIVKPAVPLSSFKVKLISSEREIIQNLDGWTKDLPLVAQEVIEGSDSDLLFYSGLWHSGKELGGFTGRKLYSIPPGMGQGTALEGYEDEEVRTLGRRFARYVKVDGPIAVEFKRRSNGNLIMIEPNVGRSEYCVDLLIQSGFNLPFMEYLSATDQPQRWGEAGRRPRTWYDSERDPFGYWRDCVASKSLFPRRTKPIFPYLGHNDPMPLLAALGTRVVLKVRGGVRRIFRRFERQSI
jgi:predicted ATP-grasp superfamily ATP-dependent carboligase